MRTRPLALAAALGAFGLLPSAAVAATSFSATDTTARTCAAGPLPTGSAVSATSYIAPDTGYLTVATKGTGDFDVAVLDQRSGRSVAAAAGPSSNEVAQGFVAKGQKLRIQLCNVGGEAATARATITVEPVGSEAAEKVQIVSVDTPTQADRTRVAALGFDDAHSHTDSTLDIVAYGKRDLDRLRRAGFSYKVELADAAARERQIALANERYGRSARTAQNRAGLPSGRTGYRVLADYESEMKKLAMENPGLVKLIELPNKSLEGRTILGLEISKDVNVDDGKPVFTQFGVHHAREWPSSEHAMEWAYELIRGFGKSDRVTDLVTRTRTIVVPIINVDGFNLSRSAMGDTGNATAMGSLPPQVNSQLPIANPLYIATLLSDQFVGFAYKRKNCRIKDGAAPAPGECGNRENNRTRGTDPNRNYGALWGGPGAATSLTSDIYRGAGPFSEPETQNVQQLVSTNQVTTLITNHTFSNLVLRPPGVKAQGETVDAPALKDLGDAMAAQNGYQSTPGFELYDTTGTTEDWSYNATGGFGYTFEIGPNEFHPPFSQVVGEYEGTGKFAGKGNREAYFVAQESTANTARHSVLEGTAPPGTVLRVRKDFKTQTSPVVDSAGNPGKVIEFDDKINDTINVGTSGKFEWHLNPSTRPGLLTEKVSSEPDDMPATKQNISSAQPVPPGQPRDVPFNVPAEGANRLIKFAIDGQGPDYDIELYEGSVTPTNLVATSASDGAKEVILYDYPKAGKYIARIINFAAVSPYTGSIDLFAPKPGSVKVVPVQKESFTLTCETTTGQVLTTNPLEVDRGQRKTLDPCGVNAGPGRVAPSLNLLAGGTSGQRGGLGGAGAKSKGLAFKLAIDERRLGRALRFGQRVRARCQIRCTVTAALVIDGKTAKRLRLRKSDKRAIVVARGKFSSKGVLPRGTFSVRFSKLAKRRLARGRNVRFALIGTARSSDGALTENARKTFALRR